MSNEETASANGDESNSQLLVFNELEIREISYKEAYGEDKLANVIKIDEDLLKAEWEAYNHKVKLLAPIYSKRSEFIKTIPGFWLKVMTNDPEMNVLIDPIDRDALSHLEDLTLEHDPHDARNVTFHFHFAKENPYFSDRQLSKKFTVAVPDAAEEKHAANGTSNHSAYRSQMIEMNKKYELEAPIQPEPVKINWTSDEHDLTAKKPRPPPDSSDDDPIYDVAEVGSFFNFFGENHDQHRLHTILLELHSKALDTFAGLVQEDTMTDDEDEDEEDGDPAEAFDLDSDAEEPKKKKPKTSA